MIDVLSGSRSSMIRFSTVGVKKCKRYQRVCSNNKMINSYSYQHHTPLLSTRRYSTSLVGERVLKYVMRAFYPIRSNMMLVENIAPYFFNTRLINFCRYLLPQSALSQIAHDPSQRAWRKPEPLAFHADSAERCHIHQLCICQNRGDTRLSTVHISDIHSVQLLGQVSPSRDSVCLVDNGI